MSHQRRTNSPTTPSHSASVATRTHLARWRRWWWTGGGATWHFISEQKGLWLPFFFRIEGGERKIKCHVSLLSIIIIKPSRTFFFTDPFGHIQAWASAVHSRLLLLLLFFLFSVLSAFFPLLTTCVCVCVPSAPPPLQRLTANCLWEFLILSRGKGDKRKLRKNDDRIRERLWCCVMGGTAIVWQRERDGGCSFLMGARTR